MANKIYTRIQLKYDSYTNWTSNNTLLLEGEIAIAKLVTTNAVSPADDPQAPVLFKVGPGNFNDLPWASALAADVYAWAKKTEAEFIDWAKGLVPVEVIDNGTGKFVTDVTATNDANGHHITITRDDAVNTLTATDDDVVILTTDKNKGDVTITGAHKEYNKAGQTTDVSGNATTAGSSVTIKVPTLAVDKYGHTEFTGETSHTITIPSEVAVGDGEIDIVANDGIELASENGTFNVNQDEDKTITIKHSAAGAVTTNSKAQDAKVVTGASIDKFGHIVDVTREEVRTTIRMEGADGYGAGYVTRLATQIGDVIQGNDGTPIIGQAGISVTKHEFTEGGHEEVGLLIDGSELQDAIDATDAKVNTLIGTDTNKSARTIATEVAKAEIGSAGHLKREIVNALPVVENADPDTIYMVPVLFTEGEIVAFEESMLEPDGNEWVEDPNWSGPYYGYFKADPTHTGPYRITPIAADIDNTVLFVDGVEGNILGTELVDQELFSDCNRTGITFSIPTKYYESSNDLYIYFNATNSVHTSTLRINRLIPAGGKDSYKEFMYIDNRFAQIGDTSVNLDGYATEDWAKKTFVYEIESSTGSIDIIDSIETDIRRKYLDIATQGVRTSHIENKAITAEKLADDVFNKLNGDYKTKQTAVVDPIANGTTDEFIASITQNENGEITATKKALPANIVRREFVNKLPTTGEAGVQYYVNTHGAEIPYERKTGRVVKTDTGYTFDSTEYSYTTLFFEKGGKTNTKVIGMESSYYGFVACGFPRYMYEIESGLFSEEYCLNGATPLQVGTNRQVGYDYELSINTSVGGSDAYDSSLVWVSFYTGEYATPDTFKIVEDVDTIYTVYEYINGNFVVISAPGASANSSMFIDTVAETAARAESKADTNTAAIENLHAVATSGSIYDIAEGTTANTGEDKDIHPKYIIFNCGSSTTVI